MIVDLLQKTFRGTYRFQRIVSSPLISYTGTAHFSSIADTHVKYCEEETYVLEEISQYAYQERENQLEKDYFLIMKMDGALLHQFDCGNEKNPSWPVLFSHTHLCRADQYEAQFRLINEDEFALNYKISGPSKKYEIETAYIKKKHYF